MRERKIPFYFTCMWNLRNKMNEQKGEEREANHKRLLTLESSYQRGGGWGMIEVGDGNDTCCHEQWVFYKSVESLYCIPETNITLYVNWNLNKNF